MLFVNSKYVFPGLSEVNMDDQNGAYFQQRDTLFFAFHRAIIDTHAVFLLKSNPYDSANNALFHNSVIWKGVYQLHILQHLRI